MLSLFSFICLLQITFSFEYEDCNAGVVTTAICHNAFIRDAPKSYIAFAIIPRDKEFEFGVATAGNDTNLFEKVAKIGLTGRNWGLSRMPGFQIWNVWKTTFPIEGNELEGVSTRCRLQGKYETVEDIFDHLIRFHEATKDSEAWKLTNLLAVALEVYELAKMPETYDERSKQHDEEYRNYRRDRSDEQIRCRIQQDEREPILREREKEVYDRQLLDDLRRKRATALVSQIMEQLDNPPLYSEICMIDFVNEIREKLRDLV